MKLSTTIEIFDPSDGLWFVTGVKVTVSSALSCVFVVTVDYERGETIIKRTNFYAMHRRGRPGFWRKHDSAVNRLAWKLLECSPYKARSTQDLREKIETIVKKVLPH